MSDKEKEFQKEYEELLKKHNVSLSSVQWFDEHGSHVDISFIENGKYCNINYSPKVSSVNKGRCGMGS